MYGVNCKQKQGQDAAVSGIHLDGFNICQTSYHIEHRISTIVENNSCKYIGIHLCQKATPRILECWLRLLTKLDQNLNHTAVSGKLS